MKLAVHGTNDGYRILYTTDDEFARIISRDIRKGAQGDEQLGKTAYSLGFVSNGCAYSKYVIVKDSLRSFATGTIAFSLFVGTDETMKAEDIFNLLNELYKSYETEYIRNHYLNRGEKVLIRVNWNFISDILSKYKTTLNLKRHEIINSGTKDPAFIYYKDDNELLEYFDKPFQVEYIGYSQILFIHNTLQGTANPIHVLKNSGIALDIDLKNEPYYLSNYIRSKKIIITANGKPRSEGQNNNIIWTKDIIDIYFSKDDQCFIPIHVNGLISESKIKKYLEIKNNEIIIKYENFDNPDPIIKKIVIEIKNYKREPIENAEIQIGDNEWVKVFGHNLEYSFIGEDLKNRFTVFGRKGDFSGERIVTPINEVRNVELILKERKKIEFEIKNEDLQLVRSFDILIKNPNNTKVIDNKIVEFIDDAIDKDCNFTITAIGYESKPDILFPRGTEKLVQIRLKRRSKKTYEVDAGKKGTASAGYSHEEDGNDINVIPKTEKYRFIGFKLEKSNKAGGFDGILSAQYEKVNLFENPKIIAVSIVVMLVFGFGIWTLYSLFGESDSEMYPQNNNLQIQHYIEGDSLILDTLTYYKESLNENQSKLLKSLDSAIRKRQIINEWKFDLMKKLHYYQSQQKFKAVIYKIDSNSYNLVKNNMGDISSWDLDKIANTLDTLLNDNNSKTKATHVDEEKKNMEKEEGTIYEKRASPKPVNKKDENKEALLPKPTPTNLQEKSEDKPVSEQVINNTPKDISQELRSSTVTKNKLQSWKTAGINRNKESIELYLRFWNIVASNQKSEFFLLRKDVKKDPILKNSELINFLNMILENPVLFDKFTEIPGRGTRYQAIDVLKSRIQ